MFRNSKFYDDILTGSYSAPMEKEASEQESDIRDIISTFGDEELDAIAQELGMISKEASEIQQSLENSLLEDEGDRVKYNVSNVPALIINDKVISQGKILNEKEIVNFIRILA